MKGSKFKIFILFIIGLLGVVIPVDAYASDYNFGYQAFSCGGTTNAQYKACITKYYNGEEIPRIENGDTVNPGDTIMLVLTYNHSIENIDDAATALTIFEKFNPNFVQVATYSTMGKQSNALYTAADSANPVFGYSEEWDTNFADFLPDWAASTNVGDDFVSFGYTYSGDTAGLMYFPGALGFTFFKVKSTAPSGQNFTFGFDTFETAAGNGTNYNAPSNPTTPKYIYNSDVTPISFKIAGATTSDDRSLKKLDITGSDGTNTYTYTATPSFTAGTSTREFDVIVPAKLTSVTLDIATTDPTAQIIKTATTTAAIGADKTVYTTTEALSARGTYTYTFIVHAESGDQDTYKINVYKLNNVATLQSLSLTNSTIPLSFNANTLTYEKNVLFAVKNTTVNATTTDTNAFIQSGTGAWSLANYNSNGGANVKTVKVKAEDCKTDYASVPGNECHSKDYVITINRGDPSTSVELDQLNVSQRIVNKTTVPAGAVDGFTSGTSTRTFDLGIVDYETSQLTFSATPKPDANNVLAKIVSGTGTKNLSVGANTFTITVKAEDDHTENYTIKVYRKSNSTNLGTLEVTSNPSGYLDPAFEDHSYGGPYTYHYPSDVTSVTISATVEDTGKATVAGDLGVYNTLNQNALIVVTSENGDTKTFTIQFEKILSTDNLLSDLTATNANLTPETFDPETNAYTATVDGNVTETTIAASLHDPKAVFVEGYGPRTVQLEYGENPIVIKVKSEYGQVNGGGENSYNIVITRQRKSIKVLDSVTVTALVNGEEQSYTATYNAATQTYSIPALPYTTTEATITAEVPAGSLATYTVFNQENGAVADGKITLATGQNNAKIRVKAHDNSTADYNVAITRTKNNVSTIESVKVFGSNATCVGTRCEITVANSHATLAPTDVDITITDEAARVTKPTNTINLSTDHTSTFAFTVTAENETDSTNYELVVTREKSTDNTLAKVTVTTNEGKVYECNSFIDFACTISVPSTTTTYSLEATKTVDSSEVTGTGTYTMGGAEGSRQTRTLTVTSESNVSQTYQITIERSKSTNANLSSITIDGNVIPEFDGVNKQIYAVTVPGTTSTINLNATVADTGKAVINNAETVLGRKNLEYGSGNVYTIQVIAEAGGDAVKTYTLTVTRLNNVDPDIAMIQVGGDNLPAFASTTQNYRYDAPQYIDLGASNPLVVPYNQTTISIVATPSDVEHGTVKYNGGNETNIPLTTGANTITVTGIAHNTSITKDYTLVVYRELNSNNSVSKIEVAGVEAILNEETGRYAVTVPNNVTKVDSSNVVVTLPAKQLETDPNATVTLPTLNLGTSAVNQYQFIVTSESGQAKTYNVDITRTKSNVKTLNSLTVTNGSFNPSFAPSVNEYTVTLPASATEFTVNYTKADDTETVNGAGRYTLASSNMDVEVEVTAEDNTKNTYTLHIVRTTSAVSTLSSITVNSGPIYYQLDKEFSPDTTSYVVEVPGTVSEVNLFATVTDDRSSIREGDIGVKQVSLGDNPFTIRVNGEENSSFTDYNVNIKVLPKDINTLEGITVNLEDGTPLTLSPEFDSERNNYTLADQPYSVTKVIVDATKTDPDSTVSGLGAFVLETGRNTITITVKAQDNTENKYYIKVDRAKNNDATLKTLNVSGASLSPSFDKNVISYNVELESDVERLLPSDVTAQATDTRATVNKAAAIDLTEEYQPYTIVVTAEDGTTKTYTINAKRKKSSDARLKSVSLENASISPAFTANNDQYTLTIPSTATEFRITGITNNPLATVEGNNTYPATTETVVLTVTAEDGVTTKPYTFNVITAEAMDATLASLEVAGYTLTPDFIKTTVVYDIGDIPFGTTSLSILASPTNPNANLNYYVDGVKQTSSVVTLPQTLGAKSITVEVVPATGVLTQARSYSITYNMITSSNNYLATLTSSSGTLTPTFQKGITSYAITVPFDTNVISFQMTTEDIQASVSNDAANYVFTSAEPAVYTYPLSVGTTTATFTVKAADGKLRDYQVAITRTNKVPSSDANLSGLSVDGYPINPVFNKDEDTYTIGAIPFSLDKLTVRALGNYAGQTITYTLNGVEVDVENPAEAEINVAGTTGSNLINVHVVAENGTSAKNYQISYTKTPSDNTYLSNMVDSMHKIESFNKTVQDYTIDVDQTVNNLTLTLTTEEEHATIGINGTTKVHQWAYEVTGLKGGVNKVTIFITAENGGTRTYTLTINKAGASELITSVRFGHQIEDGMIKSARLNETLLDLKNELDNDNTKLQIWNATETTEITNLSTPVATGQIVKLVDLTTGNELDRKVVVVVGDTSGDGEIDLFDAVKILNHYLEKELLVGPYLVAADTSKDGEVDLFDAVKILNHYLEKDLLY